MTDLPTDFLLAPTRVAVAAPPQLSFACLAATREAMPSADVALLSRSRRNETRESLDVLVIKIVQGDLTPLAEALTDYDSLGRPELVVVVEHLMDPAAHALARLGVKRIVEEPDLSNWLRQSETLLRAIARGRAAQRELTGSMNSVYEPATSGRVPRLFEAERRFREAYVRMILSMVGSRREAAELAGVPYRTFCQIAATLDTGRYTSADEAEMPGRGV